MGNELITEREFDSREAASLAAAEYIGTALATQLEAQSSAALIVGGGTSPVQCFKALANTDIGWPRVQVLLSDERWVSPQDDDSNEKLIRQNLLQESAKDAQLLAMFDASASIEQQCETVQKAIVSQSTKFSCAFLGMGEDGHFASLFPDAENLDEGLDYDGASYCIPVKTAASPHMRMSLTMAALLQSESILLLIFGEKKREVYEQAKRDPDAYPVSRLMAQTRVPVHVFWAS